MQKNAFERGRTHDPPQAFCREITTTPQMHMCKFVQAYIYIQCKIEEIYKEIAPPCSWLLKTCEAQIRDMILHRYADTEKFQKSRYDTAKIR